MTGIKTIDFRLYLITDRKLFGSYDIMLEAIEKALEGGLGAVQLREKDLSVRELLELAYRLRELTGRYGAKLFINDRADVALSVGADGVHLGGLSMPVQAVRKAFGEKLMTGVSTHSLPEAKKAEADGADFITLGPVYETLSKMQYGSPVGLKVLKDVTEAVSLPVFAIGGIKINRVKEVLQQGAYGVALISAVLAAENVRKTTEEFIGELS